MHINRVGERWMSLSDRAWEWVHRTSSITAIVVLAATMVSGGGTLFAVVNAAPSDDLTVLVWLLTFLAGTALLTLAFGKAAQLVMGRRATARNTQLSFEPPPKPQPPFLIRFKEVWPNGYIGSVAAGKGRILQIEVVSANNTPATDVEVCIDGGEATEFGTTRPNRHKITQTMLRGRRGVTTLKPGQSEEYILASSDDEEVFFWGEAVEGTPRQLLYHGAHRLQIAVFSKENPKFTKTTWVMFTGGKAELVPLPSGVSPEVWNGR